MRASSCSSSLEENTFNFASTPEHANAWFISPLTDRSTGYRCAHLDGLAIQRNAGRGVRWRVESAQSLVA